MKTKITLVVAVLITCLAAQAQWTQITSNTNRRLDKVAFWGNNGVIVGGTGRVLYSNNAGLSWDDSTYFPGNDFGAVAFASPTRVVAIAGLRHYYSDNSGLTFTSPGNIMASGEFVDVDFTSATTGIAVSNNCTISTTTDGGTTWTLGNDLCNGNGHIYQMQFVNGSVGYYCTDDGRVAKTINSGSSWTDVTAPDLAKTSYRYVQFLDADNGFVLGDYTTNGVDTFVFKKTTDGGATWTDMSAGLIDAGVSINHHVRNVSFANTMLGFAFNDYNDKIYKTTDGGATWAIDHSIPSTASLEGLYAFNGFALAVGADGYIARTTYAATVGIAETYKTSALDIYPNPVSTVINIRNMNNTTNAEMLITDITGKAIRNEKLSSAQIDVSGLAKGFYMLSITLNGSTSQQKFIVQ